MRTIPRIFAGSAVALLCTVAPAAAQAPAAGTVSRVEGSVAVARTTTPEATPLKIRDAVYQRDLVTTGEQSRAQLLLGGKATVSIRERSTLRIIEVPDGTSTIDITAGKLKLVAIKDRLKPGERVEVRMPGAIASVRGTAWISEVSITPAGPVSRITVLDGLVEVTPLDLATGRPRGPVVRLNPLQRLEISGATPPGAPQTISRADADRLDATFSFGLKTGPGGGVVERQVERATSDANDAAQGASGGRRPSATQDSGPSVSGDDIRSRAGVGTSPPTGGGGGRSSTGGN
jgi:hypothetical protein